MMKQELLKFDRERASNYDLDIRKAIPSYSIHFIPETKVTSLLQKVGFTYINQFYNAFLFGGWSARLI